MMTFEKVLEVFNDYLNKDSVLEVVNTKRGYTVMIWDEKDEQMVWCGTLQSPRAFTGCLT